MAALFNMCRVSFHSPYHAEHWLLCRKESLGALLTLIRIFLVKIFLSRNTKCFEFSLIDLHWTTPHPTTQPPPEGKSVNSGESQAFLLRTVCVLPAAWFIFKDTEQPDITGTYSETNRSPSPWVHERVSKVSQPLPIVLQASLPPVFLMYISLIIWHGHPPQYSCLKDPLDNIL